MPCAFGMTGGLGTLMQASEELTTMAATARRDTFLVLKMVAGTVPKLFRNAGMLDVGRVAHAQKFVGPVARVAEKDGMTRVVEMADLDTTNTTFAYKPCTVKSHRLERSEKLASFE